MKLLIVVLSITFLLSGCVDEPTPKEAQRTATVEEKNLAQDAVKGRVLSIEEAAEEATKLIEADAKSEVDGLTSQDEQN